MLPLLSRLDWMVAYMADLNKSYTDQRLWTAHDHVRVAEARAVLAKPRAQRTPEEERRVTQARIAWAAGLK